MNRVHAMVAALTAALLPTACVSTTSIGYVDGMVTTSPVTLQFQGPPVLRDAQGMSYRVTGDAGAPVLSWFERQGMHRTSANADVEVAIALGEPQQGPASALKLGSGWVPAFPMTTPFSVQITRAGEQVAAAADKHESVLTFQGGQTFPTKEQAIAAIDAIRKLAQKGLAQRARTEAATAAAKTADSAASRLFLPRDIQLEVPVVRSAAGVDMQQCYQLLSDPTDQGRVAQALQAYRDLGTGQQKPDGTPNQTANYGVAIGIAAAQLFAGDAAGAWQTAQQAAAFEPEGQEAQAIRRAIWQQEKATGVAVIPAAERQQIEQQERAASALQRLLSAPGR